MEIKPFETSDKIDKIGAALTQLQTTLTNPAKKAKAHHGKYANLETVIEHVKEPAKLLKISKKLLTKKGFVYIEVPDGGAASKNKNGKNREEFFVDHLHVFTKKSLRKCIELSGLKLARLKSIKEKSGKLTIYAFAKKVT